MNARIPKTTKRFRRDYIKIRRSGRKINKLDSVMSLLIQGDVLPANLRDHPLQGELNYLRDCHIEGDWILFYQLGVNDDGNDTIIFHATDNHENLFG